MLSLHVINRCVLKVQLKQILFFETCSRNQQGTQKDSTTRSSSDETLSDSCHVQEEHLGELYTDANTLIC